MSEVQCELVNFQFDDAGAGAAVQSVESANLALALLP